MTRLSLFFLILLINALVVLAYLVWSVIYKRRNRSFIICAIVMLLCPVVGPCFFLLALLLYKLLYSAPVDLADVVFSKERVRKFVHAEEERERNLASLEEAIEITESGELRTLMMNVVRGDIQKSLATIALAMNSEDTETAHYAASVLQNTLNTFQENVEKQYALIQEGEDENRLEYADALVDYMNQVLEQKVLTGLEQERYVRLLENVCEILNQEEPERMQSSHFEAVSLRLLDLEDFESCEKWCLRGAAKFPHTLASFACLLKLYFSSGQREKFFETIRELKQSPVVIDRETLELIRVFQEP